MGFIAKVVQAITNGSQPFATPAVTRPQQLALGQAVLAVLVAFGFNFSDGDRELIIGLAAALGAALPLSDAVVRRSRAQNATQIAAVQQAAQPSAPQPSERLIELLDELARDQRISARSRGKAGRRA